jgi:hypothetical protein
MNIAQISLTYDELRLLQEAVENLPVERLEEDKKMPNLILKLQNTIYHLHLFSKQGEEISS